jgi:hypothetical protein
MNFAFISIRPHKCIRKPGDGIDGIIVRMD